MTWVDLVLAVGVLVVAIAGWRSGVIATIASFVGFIGGAVLGAWLVPQLIADRDWPHMLAALAVVTSMVVLGMVGQVLLGIAGAALRDLIDFGPVRLLDRASGLVVSIVAFLMAAWMLLSVAASLALTEEAVRSSRTFPILDELLAEPGGELIEEARSLLSTFNLPSLPFNTATLPQIDEPRDVDLGGTIREVARASVVQVSATSTRCGLSQVGSGVVLADHRVVTNAHVIAGSGRVTVRVTGERRPFGATLVARDVDNDVAVLHVPDLQAPVLEWAADASRGTEGAVAGYPGGGRLTLGAARVRGKATVAQDGDRGARRVIVFRGVVRPGNSGGALLDTAGHLMGMVFANSSVDDTTGFALTRAEIRPALADGAHATQEVTSGACPTG